MEFNCPNCKAITQSDLNFEVREIACPKCHTVYHYSNGEYRFKSRYDNQYRYDGLEPGRKGTIDGITYTVTGTLLKKAYGSFYWKEYTLEDAAGNFRYLSEADGHWILLEAIQDQYDVSSRPRWLTHNGVKMSLYDYTDVKIYRAEGFFDAEIPSTVHTIDYIAAPYTVSIERSGGDETTFFGKHLSRATIGKAFPGFELPKKQGIGLVQPFPIHVNNLAIVLCVTTLLICITHYVVYLNRTEQTVLYEQFNLDLQNNKAFTSKSFVLEGGSAPMTIGLSSGVDNSWANVQVALVNENTNEEIYASKDIEYYHGYEDGESWTEGNQSNAFNICGVNQGKYHLVITPQKASEDYANHYLNIRATWDESSMRNVWFSIIMMIVFVFVVRYGHAYFERKRWEESNYTPFKD